ncbi:MAG: hypothetical protein JJU34_20915 [Lunatimonas sp.]|uniref:hypothetical protein n=1 Tax=Lunatimonas sp. TaxID=2060141 RepID=UPI00263A5CA4|nr:hypothetical protein [Lunatimonas sp.]MCC5939756.1 hypothetical protein [Lunatimonas sp.]
MNNVSSSFGSYSLLVFSLYIFLFIFPFPAQHIPFGQELTNASYGWLIKSFSDWVAYSLLRLDEVNYEGGYGSGDTTYDYVQLLAKSLLSLVGAMGLLALSKRISWLGNPFALVRVYARYFVGITLIVYGVAKFWGGQFPAASLGSLEQVHGDFSPMGLAWRFFGYSDLYKVFMGVSEIAAGALLLFRRTVVIGALLSVAVTFNIFMVNMSFDVPVKILSGHLLLFSIVILWPYLRQLVVILVCRREGQIKYEPRRFTSKRQKWVYRAAKYYLVFIIPFSLFVGQYLRQGRDGPDNPWDGAYRVTGFEVTGESIEDPVEMLVLEKNSLLVRHVSGSMLYLTTGELGDDGFMLVNGYDQDEELGSLRITQDGGLHHIRWEAGESQLSMTATRKIKSDYFLNKRGFNWINEYPVNR